MADLRILLPCALFLYLLRRFLTRRLPKSPFLSPSALRIIKTDDDEEQHLRNASGVIDMASDENRLCADLVAERLREIGLLFSLKALTTPDHETTAHHGTPALQTAVATYMSEALGRRVTFDPDRVVITAGAAAATEALSFCVADAAGNAILVPSPYNPRYDRDVKWRSGVELVDIPCRSTDDFDISPAALEKALHVCKNRRLAARALLVSNPCNPTGNVLDRNKLMMLVKFAFHNGIHFICDESHAATVYGDSFTSAAEILGVGHVAVHLIYDLGVPGFDVGVIYSYDDKILKVAQRYAQFCAVSAHAQHLLAAVLADERFVEKFVRENRRRVTERFHDFFMGLHRAGVKCFVGSGGSFCWGEMARWVDRYSAKGELAMWTELLDKAKVNVTRGCACHCIEPGWFRFSFGSVREEEKAKALHQIQDFTHRLKVKYGS